MRAEQRGLAAPVASAYSPGIAALIWGINEQAAGLYSWYLGVQLEGLTVFEMNRREVEK
jgi:hypothetical protein